MSTFVRIYLNANVIIKVNEEIESIPFNTPSNEKRLNSFPELLLNLIIRLEKDMLVPEYFFA